MNTKAIPDGYDSLMPALICKDAAKAIDFYKTVFGATEFMRMSMPGSDKIAHAEIKIRNHVLMVNDEAPHMQMFAPAPDQSNYPYSVFLYVENVDATMQKALAHGARVAMPIMDMFWGDRYGKFIDPFGHLWSIATHTRDVSPEECAKAMEAWAQKKPGECA
jgi:PhnB protein